MKAELQYARLEFPPTDVDGDGQKEVGVFEMAGNLEINMYTRTGPLVGGEGGQLNSIVSNAIAPGESKFKEGFLNLGAGQHLIEIDFTGWEGAQDEDGNSLQWGNTGNSGTDTPADVTGSSPLRQLQVLDRYIQTAVPDSRNPAYVEVGAYTEGGLFDTPDLGLDRLPVVVESPNHRRSAEDGSWWSGSMTLVETIELDQPIDRAKQPV